MKPKTKINHKSKVKPENKSKTKTLKQMLISFKVLGYKVYVSDIPTILRIGNTTGILECSERFVLLDKKIQEFFVVQMLDVYKNKAKTKGSRVDYNKTYMNADKKALMYVTEKYPTTPKLFWVFALKNIFMENMIDMNRLRLENIIKLLKCQKGTGAQKILSKYKEKEQEQKMFDKISLHDLEISKAAASKLSYSNKNDSNKKKSAPKLVGSNEKNITMRSNKMSDMSNQLLRKHPQYTILDKGLICNNFGIGGFKYYQRFWVRLKKSGKKKSQNK